MRQLRITGKIEAQPRNSGPKPKLAGYEEKLSALIKAQPDATLEELRARLGVEVELSTLWYFLDRLGLSVKKNSARQRATAQRRAGSARRMERKSTHA
jgi:transposase